jgi:PIN domain nuclease of toxin-antitoxin system
LPSGALKRLVSSIVFDSSALLAIINGEPGAVLALSVISAETLVSAVNVAEVYTKLVNYGLQAIETGMELLDAVTVVPFTDPQAFRAAEITRSTRYAGLSLGDRACLALGIELDAEVYTADRVWTDRVWADLNLDCRVPLIR